MSTPLSDAFDARRRGFEEEYFRTKDAQLVDKLKRVFLSKLDKEELRKKANITNEEVLDRLVAINVRGELLTAFKLYPLVEIAWADGKVDDRETRAVLDAAVKFGVPREGAAIQGLEAWLKRGPTKDGRAAWHAFAADLRNTLTPEELGTFRKDLVRAAKTVAEASGGFLGMVFQISPAEERVLHALEQALTST
ncbi:MAG: hypothetical protein U0572_10660 [Phycisphaerales bacterium]